MSQDGSGAIDADELRKALMGLNVYLSDEVISHKVFSKSFGRSQLPHKSVNVSFTITHIKK